MNKKGGLFDGVYVMASLFVFAIFIIFIAATYSNIKSGLKDTNSLSAEGENILDRAEEPINSYNFYFIFLLLGYIFALVAISIFIRSFRVFAVISTILMIFMITVAGMISETWQSLESSEFATQTSQFTVVSYLMNHFGLVVFIMFMCLILALYAKSRQSVGVYG